MSSNGTTSLDRLADTATADRAPAASTTTVFDKLEGLHGQIEKALPAGMSADRFARLALTQIRKTPKLAGCTWDSLAGAIMTAAQLGLEPGPLGYSWLIPRNNKSTGKLECNWQIGYTGVIKLARQSGTIGAIETGYAWPDELVEESIGTGGVNLRIVPQRPRREPPQSITKARADFDTSLMFWCVVETLGAGRDIFKVMDHAETFRIAEVATKYQTNSPWFAHYAAMSGITVFRSMKSWLPLSDELAQAFAHDGTVRTDLDLDYLDTTPPIDAIEVESTETGDAVPTIEGDAGEPVPVGDDEAPTTTNESEQP